MSLKDYPSSEEVIGKLKDKYPGLDVTKLHQGNPSYSCIICGNTSCNSNGKSGAACPDHVLLTPEEFAQRDSTCGSYAFDLLREN